MKIAEVGSSECYCFHLAAVVGRRDLSIDAEYWQWAAKVRPAKTITFSSSAAYPIRYQRREGYRVLEEPMIEIGSDIGMPDISYGWAKLTCEYSRRR
jgi:hypothetical protein